MSKSVTMMLALGLGLAVGLSAACSDDDGSNGNGQDVADTGGETDAPEADTPTGPQPLTCQAACELVGGWLGACGGSPGPPPQEELTVCVNGCEAAGGGATLPSNCRECAESSDCSECCLDFHCAQEPDPAMAQQCGPPPPAVDCTSDGRSCFWDSDCEGDLECNSETRRCFDPADARNCAGTPCFWDTDCPSESCNSTEEMCN